MLVDGYELSLCVSIADQCKSEDGLRDYNITFTGFVSVNGKDKAEWTKEEIDQFALDESFLKRTCDFNCKVNGKAVYPEVSSLNLSNEVI